MQTSQNKFVIKSTLNFVPLLLYNFAHFILRIDIITVLPELLRSPFEASIMKRAIDKGLVEVHFHNLRDYTTNKQTIANFL
jgi:tRNA (guanine37-N1)-methyltransferase